MPTCMSKSTNEVTGDIPAQTVDCRNPSNPTVLINFPFCVGYKKSRLENQVR